MTSTTYNAAGWVEDVTDPRALVRRTTYDNAGRVTKTVDHYTNGTPTDTSNRTTEYTYDGSDHVLTLKAVLPSSNYQTTQWVYGVTGGVYSNDLLAEVRHPDKSSGSPSTSEKEVFTVNALGERKTATDRNGTVHTYGYDVVGRFLSDAVTTLGSGVEGSVRRQEVAYDSAGLAFRFTTYDAASGGSVVNQVQRVFDGLGQLTKEYQEHTGAVDDTEPVTSPKVQYAYSFAESGTTNHSRPTSLTYPDTRVVNYNYATGVDTTISRLSSLSNGGTTYEQYAYLGLATVVKRVHLSGSNEIGLTYIKQSGESNGDAGDQYTSLDRFGRIIDQRWIKDSDPTNPLDRFKYGYDRNSNRVYRENAVSAGAAFSELYHERDVVDTYDSETGELLTTGYDHFNQVTDFVRGTLNGAKDDVTETTPPRTQSWDFDALGNWETLTTNGNDEDREHNKQNQVTVVGGNAVDFDNNGNMIEDQTGKGLVYDAWNRLVQVQETPGGSAIRSYVYDALGRRVLEINGTLKQFYFYCNRSTVFA